MADQKISNEMLLKLLTTQFQQIDKRFEQIDKRFEQIDKRFEQIDARLDIFQGELRDIKYDVRSDRRKLDEVYENRKKVAITFGWQWGVISLFMAIFAAGASRMFV